MRKSIEVCMNDQKLESLQGLKTALAYVVPQLNADLRWLDSVLCSGCLDINLNFLVQRFKNRRFVGVPLRKLPCARSGSGQQALGLLGCSQSATPEMCSSHHVQEDEEEFQDDDAEREDHRKRRRLAEQCLDIEQLQDYEPSEPAEPRMPASPLPEEPGGDPNGLPPAEPKFFEASSMPHVTTPVIVEPEPAPSQLALKISGREDSALIDRRPFSLAHGDLC